jgi:hypothetical protein
MTSKKHLIACLAALALCASVLAAQSGDKYQARLAPAPPLDVPGNNQAKIAAVAGLGTATATLSGKKLTVNGTFDKMASAPTAAKVGLGLAPGARLDLILDLAITKSPQATPAGTSGTFAGAFDLTPAQIDGLKKGKMYIQINSEGAPKGHLLGWLLK